MLNFIFIVLLVFFPFSTFGAVDLPWSQNMDTCSDHNIWESSPLDCSGIDRFYAGTCGNGMAGTISADAAMGGTGKGIRTWHSGTNIPDGGSFAVLLNENQEETWFRFYIRFPLGMTYSSLEDYKLVWVTDIQNDAPVILGLQDSGICSNSTRYWIQNGSSQVVCGTTNKGWGWMMGGGTGDGRWHLVEGHLKRHTTSSPFNGVAEIKIDGEFVLESSNIDFGNNNLTSYRFDINTKIISSSGCQPIDFDNLAISNTGWIGGVSDAQLGGKMSNGLGFGGGGQFR